MNKVFFSDNGLSSTSANHLCNVAKEYIQSKKKQLENISFINTNLKVIGSENETVVEIGTTSVDWIESTLEEIGMINSLVAWLREAIKEKAKITNEACCYSFASYLKDNNIVLPEYDADPILTEEEYYNSLPIKQRNRYYQLETLASVIGKYIHPEGRLNEARERLKDKMNKPIVVDKNGRDTLIYSHTASLDPNAVDEVFFRLQNKHREIQAQLNQIKGECDQAIADSKIASDEKAKAKYLVYSDAQKKAYNDYQICINEKTKAAKNLKIVIPDSLSKVYEKLNNIGK